MRAVVGVLLLAGLVVTGSAVGGTEGVRPKLALMPLPASVLGSQVAELPLAHDSGVVSNAEAASDANEATSASTLAALGRVSGYQLDFGGDTPAHGSLYEVETSVEMYTSAAAAGRGLAFWRRDDADTAVIRKEIPSISIALSLFDLPAFGAGGFGDQGAVTVKGASPYRGSDIDFRVGQLVAMVVVAGPGGALRALALKDALALRTRIGEVLTGRVSGPRTVLPGKQKVGPAPNGPNLEQVALLPSDFVVVKVASQGYTPDGYNGISQYQRTMRPAGGIVSFQEQVSLYPNAIAAVAEFAGLRELLTTKAGEKESGFSTVVGGSHFNSHIVSLVAGGESFAIIGQAPGASKVELAIIVIRVGDTIELLYAANPTTLPIPDAEVSALATAAARRASAGLQQSPVR